MTHALPTISIVIPTLNEEKRIEACLRSIYEQDYPKKLLEVIVVDNYSTDETVEIVRNYPVVIVKNRIHDTQRSKKVGLDTSRGDLVYHVDADMEFRSKDYLRKLAYPLQCDSRLIGSFGAIATAPDDTPLNRFLTYDIHQRDPVLDFFSPSLWSTVVAREKCYILCVYRPGNIPPEGRCLYWRKRLMKTPIAQSSDFRDLDSLVTLVESGLCHFAYVPGALAYHRHVEDLCSLVVKRLRNIRRNFLPHYETRQYTWFRFHSVGGIIKIIFWIVWAHLFFPAFVRGCIKAVRHRDIACVWYEPLLALLLTDITLYGFITNARGIRFIWSKILR